MLCSKIKVVSTLHRWLNLTLYYRLPAMQCSCVPFYTKEGANVWLVFLHIVDF